MLPATSVMDRLKSEASADFPALSSICDQCAVPFDPRSTYTEHLTRCPATKVEEQRKYLQESFVVGKPFPCIACRLERMKKKELWKSETRTEKCIVCTNEFPLDNGLHMHKTEDGRLVCGMCMLPLDEDKIYEHVLKHMELRSCLLKLCSVECVLKHTSNFKARKNDKQRFFCPVCFTAVIHPTAFKYHVAKHFEILSCEICKLSFRSNPTLKSHLNKHHRSSFDQRSLIFRKTQPQTMFTCDHCNAKLAGKRGLIQHINEMHFRTELDECRLKFVETINTRCRESVNYSNLKFLYPPYLISMHDSLCCRPKKIKEYFSSTFQEGMAFPQHEIYGKRRLDLEIIPQLALPIPCGNCRKQFLPDNTIPIYESTSGTLVCGYCKDDMSMQDLFRHQYQHIYRRSFLFDICSRSCLLTLIAVLPEASFKKFKCIACFQQFLKSESWRRHLVVHLPESEWTHVCQNCGRRFPSEGKLKVHKSTHTVNFPCPFCLAGYIGVKTLEGHIQNAHPSQSEIGCLACEKKFNDSVGYANHLRACKQSNPNAYMVEDELSLECIQCKSNFPDLSSAKNHKEVCSSLLRCYHCDFTSHSLSNVRWHIQKVHFGKARFVTCNICNIRLKDTQLHNHRRRNHFQTKKEIVCEVCGMKFTSETSYYIHKLSKHRKPDRFKCEKCPKSFGLKHHLKQHVFYNHTAEFPFQCDKCGNKFRRESNLKEHTTKTCKKH